MYIRPTPTRGTPASLAAYAIGATLWAPALVLIAGQVGMVLGLFIPGLPAVGPVRLFAVVWLLRFALYIVGAARNFDYGYGVNGVVVIGHGRSDDTAVANAIALAARAIDSRVNEHIERGLASGQPAASDRP